MENDEMIYGEGEGGTTVSIPNPLGVKLNKFDRNYYGALAALHLWAMTDPAQYPNADEAAKMVIGRTQTFVNKVIATFGSAFI